MKTIITKVENNRVVKFLEVEDDVAEETLAKLLDRFPEAFIYDGAYLSTLWVENGQVSIVPIEKTAAEIKLEAEIQQAQNIKSDAVINYLITHTPVECAAYVRTNVTNLATAVNVLEKFAMALCVLAKDKLR